VRMPLHAAPQVEGVDAAVFGNVPALGEARQDPGRAALELDDAAVHLRVRVEGGPRGVDGRIEVFRAAFGAMDQRLGEGGLRGEEDRYAGGRRENRASHGRTPIIEM